MLPDRHPFVNGTPKIGVYVCHCGTNISDKVDVEEVARWAAEKLRHRGVIVARDYKFMCSSLGQNLIEDDIREFKLNRVVVAACSPHLHEHTFRTACARAGLNVSWVHTDRAEATAKAKELISGGVERVRHHVPLDPLHVEVNPNTLVVGGGVAGIQAALEIADSGQHVYLVEREPYGVVGRQQWSSAGESLESRRRWKSPTPATTFTWSSANPASAGIWPCSTRPSRPSTARRVF